MKTNKNFKAPKPLSYTFLFLILLAAFTCMMSCRNNANEGTPPVSIMAANSEQGSAAQDFYVDNTKMNSSAIAYGQSSGYFTTTAGNHQVQFKNSTSGSVSATNTGSFAPGGFYSVFFADNGTANVYQNDHTTPQPGNARVRVIDLSSATTTGIDFYSNANSKATLLANGVAQGGASTYYEVSAATTFSINASGSQTVMLNIPVVLQVGKIYTIVIAGTTNATVNYTLIAEN